MYEQALLLGEANLLLEWFVPAVLGNVLPLATAHEYAYLWRIIIDRCTEMPLNLVLRDYHIDNLIHMEKREGIKACGLVDFQDAVKGPVTYDLVSLVEDARRDVSVEVARAVKQRYLDACAGVHVVSIGHGGQEIVDAMAEQAAKICFTYGRFITQPQIDLAQQIASLTPGDLNRVFFVSGGSEATE